MVKEVIGTLLNDRKEGKKQLIEWFLKRVMEEKAGVQLSSLPYERTDERKGTQEWNRK